ncbi:MAG: hypothetical protein M1825_000209 [Sarcosagium campestre]|nr:MAG: hypothetical protein M1825_000209 [Sarcosagium campestre]
MAQTTSDPAHETQTVQLKGPDALKQCEEPEWRRKVLKGELETKEGLFAPTGLEKLFDPPPDVSYMPSSPPVHFPPRCRSQGDNSHVSSNERFSPICVTPYVTAKGKFGFSTKSPWVPSEPSSSIVFPSNLTMGTDVPLRLKPRSPTTVQDNEVDESPQTDYPEECKMSDELPLPERRAVEHHERSDASRSDSFARKVSRKSSIQTADYFAEAERVMAAIRARGREQDRERNQRREIQSQRPASDDGMGTGRAHVSNNWRDGQTTPDISTRSRPRSSDGTPGRERFQENWRDGPATLDTSELKQYRNASERFDARKRRMSHQNSGPLEIKKTRATLPKAASNNPLSVRKTIRPEALSHLVPDRVANLVFDREAKKWISAKAYDKLRGLANGVLTSDESEEDPFKNIPDLPVDEASAAQKTVAPPKADSIEQEIEPDDDGTVDQNSQAEQRYRLENGLEPIPEESLGSLAEHKSEHRFDHKIDPKLSTVDEVPTVASIETVSVEHEIQAHEGRSEIASPQARNITISFTSPVVSRFREYTAESPSQSINETACGHFSRATSPSRAARQTSLTPSHRSFELRATDQAELSVCSGPAGNGSICLKSLPDIGEEESEGTLALSAITLRGYRHRRTSHTPPRCSLAEEKIVSALTDVKPFDPHWDRLHDVDLSGKDLPSLYKLEKYCPELVELDVSNNQISQLIGAPSGIRYLNAANNMLSSITSWGHLMNLQFLDVSNNRLESLDSFKSLVHLREVKADNNRIKNLDAVAEMEGLTKLSLVGNELENVEVEETRL